MLFGYFSFKGNAFFKMVRDKFIKGTGIYNCPGKAVGTNFTGLLNDCN